MSASSGRLRQSLQQGEAVIVGTTTDGVTPVAGRLTLTLRHGDSVTIGDATVTVLFARRGAARLIISAPKSVEINRTKETRDESNGGGQRCAVRPS